MKKTFCDHCGNEVADGKVQRFSIFDINKCVDLCEDCYLELCRWLKNVDGLNKKSE